MGKNKAFLVSVSNNDGDSINLPFCINDLELMRFGVNRGLKFDEDNIEVLGTSGNVSVDNFNKKLVEFCSSLQNDDNVLFYFSGHGGISNSKHVLLFTDDIVNSDEIMQLLNDVGAKSVFVILDCCNAGGVDITHDLSLEIEHSISSFNGVGFGVLASSLSNQSSYKHPNEDASLCTYFLANALVSDWGIRKGYKNLHSIVKQTMQLYDIWAIGKGMEEQYPIFLSNMGGTVHYKVSEDNSYITPTFEYETNEYYVVETEPCHADVKRYVVKVILKDFFDVKKLSAIVREIASTVEFLDIYSSESSEVRFKGQLADDIFVYFAMDEIDLNGNFICRATWSRTDEEKEKYYRTEKESIVINDVWFSFSTYYKSMKKHILENTGSKESVENEVRTIRSKMIISYERIMSEFEKFESKLITELELREKIKSDIEIIDREYFRSTDLEIMPIELEEWDQAHQNIFAIIHNVTLYWNDKSNETWLLKNRIYLTKSEQRSYHEELMRIEKLENK